VDELFNAGGIYPGMNFSKVFRYHEYIDSNRPGSVAEAFALLRRCEPVSREFLGLKICGWQSKKIIDFEKMLKDSDILKIFIYRKDEMKLYLTRFFHLKLRKGSTKGFSSMSYLPDPFKSQQALKPKSEGRIIEVECEDFFDFRVNSATTLCHQFGLNDVEVKNLAVKKIWNSPIKPLKEILTGEELAEMVKFFNMKYGFDELAHKEFRDCRNVFLNLGFL